MSRWTDVTTVLVAVGVCSFGAFARTTNVIVVPIADAFLHAEAPQENYGRAGSLTIGGGSATNGFGVPGGRFESLLRFSLADAVASLDALFGNHDWFVASAALWVNEVAAPNNALFPRGAAGVFEVRWLASDSWAEGTGAPSGPTRDGVAYQDLARLLDPLRDESLGVLTNRGINGPVIFNLNLTARFLADLRAGGEVTLHLRPASDTIGFVFNSRNFVMESARPRLELIVAAGSAPRIDSIERIGVGEIGIRFHVRSNWTHVLQTSENSAAAGLDMWTNRFAIEVQPFDTEAEIRDFVTNVCRRYRLSISPP